MIYLKVLIKVRWHGDLSRTLQVYKQSLGLIRYDSHRTNVTFWSVTWPPECTISVLYLEFYQWMRFSYIRFHIFSESQGVSLRNCLIRNSCWNHNFAVADFLILFENFDRNIQISITLYFNGNNLGGGTPTIWLVWGNSKVRLGAHVYFLYANISLEFYKKRNVAKESGKIWKLA